MDFVFLYQWIFLDFFWVSGNLNLIRILTIVNFDSQYHFRFKHYFFAICVKTSRLYFDDFDFIYFDEK
jgi:hypothetical protein